MINHYQVLGLNANGCDKYGNRYAVTAIDAAYIKRVKALHFDCNGDKDAFMQLAQSKGVLIDPEQRAQFDAQLNRQLYRSAPFTFDDYSSDKDLQRLMRFSCLFADMNDKQFLLKLFSAMMVRIDSGSYQVHAFFRSYYYDFLESKVFKAIDNELERLGECFFTDIKRKCLIQLKKELVISISDAVLNTPNQKEAVDQMNIGLHTNLTQKLQLAAKSAEVNQERNILGAFIRELLGKLLTWVQPSKNWNSFFHTRTYMILDSMNSKMAIRKL